MPEVCRYVRSWIEIVHRTQLLAIDVELQLANRRSTPCTCHPPRDPYPVAAMRPNKKVAVACVHVAEDWIHRKFGRRSGWYYRQERCLSLPPLGFHPTVPVRDRFTAECRLIDALRLAIFAELLRVIF